MQTIFDKRSLNRNVDGLDGSGYQAQTRELTSYLMVLDKSFNLLFVVQCSSPSLSLIPNLYHNYTSDKTSVFRLTSGKIQRFWHTKPRKCRSIRWLVMSRTVHDNVSGKTFLWETVSLLSDFSQVHSLDIFMTVKRLKNNAYLLSANAHWKQSDRRNIPIIHWNLQLTRSANIWPVFGLRTYMGERDSKSEVFVLK